MKAIILAAGRGNRLSNKTNNINKCMLELNGKPILEYNLDRAAEIDEVDKIIIVVGYKADDIISRYGLTYKEKSISYVYQYEQKGLVDALKRAETALNGEDFFLMLGDEILVNSRHKEMVKEFLNNNYIFGFCGMIEQKDLLKISKTYGIFTSNDYWEGDYICRLIEKPRTPSENFLQGTGHCVFRNSILDYVDETPVNIRRGRQEKELPDLIQCVVDNCKIVKPYIIADNYCNINCEEDLVEAEEMLK